MQIPNNIQARIVRAANELFEKAGRESFPTVDQVRRMARVDMNAASAVMKEWRRAQTAQAAPVAVQVPEPVAQLHLQGLTALWGKAQDLANESLRMAQSGWETEREELEVIRQELADAFEQQANELEQAKAASIQAAQEREAAMKQVLEELAAARTELAQAITRADRAEAKVEEIERRADDLHAELDRAHQEVDQARTSLDEKTTELRAMQEKATIAETEKQAEIKAGQKAMERMTAELTQLRSEVSQAREVSARMEGELETLKTQNVALLSALKPAEQKSRQTRKGKRTRDSGLSSG